MGSTGSQEILETNHFHYYILLNQRPSTAQEIARAIYAMSKEVAEVTLEVLVIHSQEPLDKRASLRRERPRTKLRYGTHRMYTTQHIQYKRKST